MAPLRSVPVWRPVLSSLRRWLACAELTQPLTWFFAAVARKDVTKALQRELEALCQQRAPDARWVWSEPPRSEAAVVPVRLPALEEGELLTNPVDELERVEALLRNQPAAE